MPTPTVFSSNVVAEIGSNKLDDVSDVEIVNKLVDSDLGVDRDKGRVRCDAALRSRSYGCASAYGCISA